MVRNIAPYILFHGLNRVVYYYVCYCRAGLSSFVPLRGENGCPAEIILYAVGVGAAKPVDIKQKEKN